MAAQDSEHKALLDQHNSRKQEHDCAVREVSRLELSELLVVTLVVREMFSVSVGMSV